MSLAIPSLMQRDIHLESANQDVVPKKALPCWTELVCMYASLQLCSFGQERIMLLDHVKTGTFSRVTHERKPLLRIYALRIAQKIAALWLTWL